MGLVLRLEPYQPGEWPDGMERRNRRGGSREGGGSPERSWQSCREATRGQPGSLVGIEGRS